MTKFVALLTLLCGLAYVSAESKPCGPYMFKDCCTIPKLIPKEVFHGCVGLPPMMGKDAFAFNKKAPKTSEASVPTDKPAAKDAAKPKFAGFGGGFDNGGPMCIMDCVMKNQSLLTSSGDVDVAAVTEKFAGSANETWKQLLTDAVSTCEAGLAKVDMTTTPAPPPWMKKVCKPTAGFFMTCLRRYITLNCPESAKSADPDQTCAKNTEGLKTCDPFTISRAPPLNFMDGLRKMAQRQKKTGASKSGTAEGAEEGKGMEGGVQRKAKQMSAKKFSQSGGVKATKTATDSEKKDSKKSEPKKSDKPKTKKEKAPVTAEA